jgi:hypothetical protein
VASREPESGSGPGNIEMFRVEQARFPGRHTAPATRRPLGGADRRDQDFSGAGMVPVEEAAELGLGDLAGQAEPFAERPNPPPRGFAVAQVIVLRRPGDLSDVIVGGAVSQFPDVEHARALPEGSKPAL